jgi:hypothetical protein
MSGVNASLEKLYVRKRSMVARVVSLRGLVPGLANMTGEK